MSESEVKQLTVDQEELLVRALETGSFGRADLFVGLGLVSLKLANEVQNNPEGEGWHAHLRLTRTGFVFADMIRQQREMRDKYEARIRELTEWRPMSEAPKDGTRVLLKTIVYGDFYALVGYWCAQPQQGEPHWVHEGVLGNYKALDHFEDRELGWLPIPEVSRG